jgi:hypothetical protein
MIKSIIFIFLTFVLSACINSPKLNTSKPLWLKDRNNIDRFHAIGSAPVNFQGVYMQQNEAINKAKNDLAHSLKTHITSVYKMKQKVNNEKVSTKSLNRIKAISNTFLHENYQIDAYFDEDKKLYVLIENPRYTKKFILRNLENKEFNNKKLLESRCYSKKILSSIKTKANMHKNRPIWFYRPAKNGSVGIAEKEEYVDFAKQKRVALSLAKLSLAKRQRIKVISQHDILSIVSDNVFGSIFESSSIVKTATKVKPTTLKDIWMDPESCEIYVYIVLYDR